MDTDDVVWLLGVLEDHGVEAWLEGGWGVDALLGEATRLHKDVDVIVRLIDVQALRDALRDHGFVIVVGNPDWGFLLEDEDGRRVDVRAVVFDEHGNGVYRPDNGDEWVYPADAFTGIGTVGGREVSCLTPAAQVQCRTGYPPADKDVHELRALHARFGVPIPPEFLP